MANREMVGHEYDKRRVDPIQKGMLRINDLIAPDAIELGRNHVIVGDRWMRTLIVNGFPRFVEMGYLNDLYSFSANIDISTHIEPLDSAEVIKMLGTKISQYNSTIEYDEEKKGRADINEETALEDAEELRELIYKNQTRMYYQSFYINVSGRDLKDLNDLTGDIESLCGRLGLVTRQAMLQQDLGFVSVLPVAEDRLRLTRNFDSYSLASCFPLVSAEMTDMRGEPILYGINKLNRSLVMFDRFKLNNYNSITVAQSGVGKSFFVKTEALRYNAIGGAQLLVIDPQGEWERITNTLDGQYINLSLDGGAYLNPFDILSTEEDEGKDFLTRKAMNIFSIIDVMVGEERTFRNDEKKIIAMCTEEAYAEKGITRKKGIFNKEKYSDGDKFSFSGEKREMPTFSDLISILRDKGGEIGVNIAEEIEPHIKGALRIFNKQTNVDSSSDLIVFGIEGMEEQMRPVGMYITLEFVFNKIKTDKSKKKLLVVDEAWMLLGNKETSKYINTVAKTARKYFAGLSIISQNTRDFTVNDGSAIISNCSMHVLLKQHPSEIDDVVKMFKLTNNERNRLLHLDTGEALITAGGYKTLVEMTANDFDRYLCTTKPEELEEIIKESALVREILGLDA